jgi:hypothetical protein
MTISKPQVFISHTSQDKSFVEELARNLRRFGIDVWYDKWEIAVSDSIVDKVFEGLEASDTLIIVLSQVSVTSRWVKEELSTAVMRRISENNIRIFPVLIETCEIPAPLRHIRYADFRDSSEEGLLELLDSLAPGHLMWQSLAHLYDHLCLLCNQLVESELNTDASDKILKIHSLLESAVNLRTEIEVRRTRQKMQDLNFFEKIGLLAERGIDVRSQTWNTLVRFRAYLAHEMAGREIELQMFAQMLQERYATENLRDSLESGMFRLQEIMHKICFDKLDYEKLDRRNRDEWRT